MTSKSLLLKKGVWISIVSVQAQANLTILIVLRGSVSVGLVGDPVNKEVWWLMVAAWGGLTGSRTKVNLKSGRKLCDCIPFVFELRTGLLLEFCAWALWTAEWPRPTLSLPTLRGTVHHLLAYCLNWSLWWKLLPLPPSLLPSLPLSLPPSLPPSLLPSLPTFLSPSLPPSLPPFLPLPVSLPPPPVHDWEDG